jgi:hypothetical protein
MIDCTFVCRQASYIGSTNSGRTALG